MSTEIKRNSSGVLHIIVYVSAAVVLFAPVLTKYFVSDDFIVLNRVCLNKIILIKGFFRPLSDISIYGNYLMAGFNPTIFNLTNIALHGFNSFLVYSFCLKWKWAANARLQYIYALTAGILFLTYPFHNESIVWLLGRGSLIAGTFGMMAMLILVSGWTESVKIIGFCLCYFIGLLAYESIIMMPVILSFFLMNRKISFRGFSNWTVPVFVTLGFHLLIRIYISGSIFGSYGGEMIKNVSKSSLVNVFKVAGRLVIPPLQNSFILFIIFAVVTVILLLALFFVLRNSDALQKKYLLTLLGALACTLVIPILFGVSTKTSESDRFNYFPSFFLCCVISFAIVKLVKTEVHWKIALVFVCLYNIFFLERNNLNWLKAALTTKEILHVVKENTSSKKLFIANLPNELDGAFVFRLGFKQALLINNIDTGSIVILNILSKEESLELPEIIKPVYSKNIIFIPPAVEINMANNGADTIIKTKEKLYYPASTSGTLYYWNKKDWVIFQ